jgi:peptidyl-prolyl cis-trans isomerase A (cyclophilin A)
MHKLIMFTACLLVGSSLGAQPSPAPKKPPSAAGAHHPVTLPATVITGTPTVTFDTTAGQMRCTLFPNKAPKGVENFIGLALGTKEWTDPNTGKKKRGVPLYNGTIFHRVIPNFMIQGGDPLGTGTGGPGYAIPDEIAPDLRFDVPGRLAYANSGPNTNGSQFFITEVPTAHLDGGYVILGQCDPATVELVKQISRRARDDRNDRPFEPVTINTVSITGVAMPTKKPVAKKPATTKKAPPKQ